MKKLICFLMLGLAACTQSPSAVRITNDVVEPAVVAAKPMRAARSEPVFYNGKTYKLNMAPNEQGHYDVAVVGMSAGQQKDAKAFSATAFHHFNCKDSQLSKFVTQPSYIEGNWQSQMSCG